MIKKYRCPNGTKKCITGKCVKKTNVKTQRCKKGMRKCANNNCYSSTIKKEIAALKIQKTYRNYINKKLINKTPKEQIEHFNKIQDKFILSLSVKKVTIYTNNEDKIECATLLIHSPTHLYLDMLNKCGENSGTQVIKLIEKFAKQYGYNKIELEDDSRIYSEKTPFRKKGGRCMIWLPILQILSSGTTWYNKLGYTSKYYKTEVKHNEAVIKKSFVKFMNTLVANTFNQDKRAPSLESLIEGMYLFVGKDENNISVKDLFTKVSKKLRNQELICNDGNHPELEWYIDIEKFLVDRGALISNPTKANPNNIMYLRGNTMLDKITQIKYI
jgi:hypothetical protein